MERNEFFDFTRHIKADMKTFLQVMHGSFLTPSNETLLLWKNIAHEVFAETLPENVVSNNGQYDKLIMQCALRRNLRRRQVFHGEGGCDFFLPTLTSKGLCHTFNGLTPSVTWKESNITNEFQKVFHNEHTVEKFQGAGNAEGEKLVFLRFCSGTKSISPAQLAMLAS